ncbi:hypothetical protein C8F01DRAFT_1062267 [Mycena amicta]|nr:hypothetical protein C8F01DRAFT_1062267 [Mycena amicta]
MDTLSIQPLKQGLVNLPGATPQSAELTAKLLHKDFLEHHCYFNDMHFHDHLAHHVLSMYDLGASADAIQAKFDIDQKMQRNLFHGKSERKVGAITEDNWRNTLGEKHAPMYADYLEFFSRRIVEHGVPKTLEKYLFSPEANGNGTMMLARFFGGVVHPIIQVGFGIEFGQDAMVAQGLALAALTSPEGEIVMEPSGLPEITTKTDSPSPSLLSLLREVYDHPTLTPMPFPGLFTPGSGASFNTLVKWVNEQPKHGATLREIYSKWPFDLSSDTDIHSKIDEALWQAALLLGGVSPADRKPRVDFFLAHLLTSALALRPIVDVLTDPLHKAQLLQTYARSCGLLLLLRGTPKIDCSVVMNYPIAPKHSYPGSSAWFPILNNAGVHTEVHVVKVIRALFYSAQRYGLTKAGGLPGAVDSEGKETHPGAKSVDGTLFIRVAGVVTNALGWASHGEEERGWDFNGLWAESWAEGKY